MRLSEVKRLVEGTNDPTFALDSNGLVVAWNASATQLFGLSESDATGRFCSEVVQGVDECGRACSMECTIQHQAREHQPIRSYEIQVNANGKRQWCNVSVLMIEAVGTMPRYTIHIARPADLQKRFELLVRDFVVNETSLSTVNVTEILTAKRAPTNFAKLTQRETEILRHLSRGETTPKIAEALFISRTTANNHIQHILKKLGAHTRLEAVRRAEQAMLI
ncbi:MAG: LuxR C-terminal-related transcriptional regulator [Pyrinomonadaceae bacterium]